MIKAYDKFVRLAIKELPKTSEGFLTLKRELSGKLRLPMTTNADLREHYEKMIKAGKIKRNQHFEKIMLSRRIRTQSGVAVVAVLTKPYPCPGKCIYCPDERGMPKSYLSNEPAVMRAIASKFDPALQVWNRLRSLELNGHATDKIELIAMGGTFSYLPKVYQKWFIWQCFEACNYYPKKLTTNLPADAMHQALQAGNQRLTTLIDLFREQKKNEKAKHRIVGLTLETRPDYIDEKEIKNFRELGCTRVELGVQSIFDDVLKLNRRGHDVAQTIRATKLLKDAGFKISYHIMPGLPGSNLKKDYKMFHELFNNSDFQPDLLKIYPTVIIKNSALYKLYSQKNQRKSESKILHFPAAAGKCNIKKLKNYRPLNDKSFAQFILEIKNEIIPPYVRISRLVRDVPATSIIAGPKISNIRQIIAHKSKCQCIRCREVRADYNIREKIVLNRIDYQASGGREIFLQYINPPLLDKERDEERSNKLFALLRLRIPYSVCHPERAERVEGSNLIRSLDRARDDKLHSIFPVLRNAAVVRELHTYGKLTPINKKDKKSPQHIGLGKRLMAEAERIARVEFNLEKIVVISGVGVRDYYRKLGYRQKETYMVKRI